MAQDHLPPIRYVTRYCALLKRDVAVVLIQNRDGSWVLGRCSEKGKACTGHQCPFRMQDQRVSLDAAWF